MTTFTVISITKNDYYCERSVHDSLGAGWDAYAKAVNDASIGYAALLQDTGFEKSILFLQGNPYMIHEIAIRLAISSEISERQASW
jgi:hypothetical protein